MPDTAVRFALETLNVELSAVLVTSSAHACDTPLPRIQTEPRNFLSKKTNTLILSVVRSVGKNAPEKHNPKCVVFHTLTHSKIIHIIQHHFVCLDRGARATLIGK